MRPSRLASQIVITGSPPAGLLGTSGPGGARALVLVRHAEPVVDFTQPASTWPLSADGVRAASALARVIGAEAHPDVLVVSPEVKAVQTATPLAEQLGLAITLHADVREHAAPGYLPADAFQNAVRAFFTRPADPVFGETAQAAAHRFARAVGRANGSRIAIVSHGRILSAYLAALTGICGWRIWRDLKMPDALHAAVDATGRMTIGRLGPEPAPGPLPSVDQGNSRDRPR